jgi:transketolase
VLATLLARQRRHDPADPRWPDRDRLLCPPPEIPGAETLPPARFQLLPLALGCALAERLLAARFGRSLVDHRTWAVLDAAELACGAAQEAASLAAELGLARLCVVAADPEAAEQMPRFAALGWSVRLVSPGSRQEAEAILGWAMRARRPTLIVAPTRAPHGEGGEADAPPRAQGARRAWLRRLARHPMRAEFERAQAGRLPAGWQDGLAALLPELPGLDTAAALRRALERLAPALPELAGGAPGLADLPPARPGVVRAIDWRGRVQAMAGTLNGMALHGGLLPLGGAALMGSDVLRPALRTAARGFWRTVLLLREDGEGACQAELAAGLAALRGVPNLHVFRPADAAEALECGELALRRLNGPSAILVSGQAARLPQGRPPGRRCVRGAYLRHEPPGGRDLTLIASGREVALAAAVAEHLAALGLAAALVSMPCWSLFAAQEPALQEALLGTAPRFAIEPGEGFGWERWLGPRGRVLPPEPGGDAAMRLAQTICGHIEAIRKAA